MDEKTFLLNNVKKYQIRCLKGLLYSKNVVVKLPSLKKKDLMCLQVKYFVLYFSYLCELFFCVSIDMT